MASDLHQRLLQDIAELQAKPYPNVTLHVQDEDITTACLILTVVDGYGPMHLTVHFPKDYPLSPPKIQMDSDIRHPNIFGTYICASILNTKEGYTPAYTLKGIAIQLLSFFSSDKIEQVGGGYSVDLSHYRGHGSADSRGHACMKCNFRDDTSGSISGDKTSTPVSLADLIPQSSPERRTIRGRLTKWKKGRRSSKDAVCIISQTSYSRMSKSTRDIRNRVISFSKVCSDMNTNSAITQALALLQEEEEDKPSIQQNAPLLVPAFQNANIPAEIMLLIFEKLETEDLMAFAQAWDRVGGIMTTHDVIRTRELQCFCLKEDYLTTLLGVGVSVTGRGKGFLESEFDLLSRDGFRTHRIRRSVQGVPFQHWLPLPISNGHWRRVKEYVPNSLDFLAHAANLGNVASVQVIYNFMNDVVVKLNQQTSQATVRSPFYPYEEMPKSSLTHASEKAIESYFHLFHLLLCLATSQPSIVATANKTLRDFLNGATSKVDCPSLGHLLVSALISDVDINEKALKSIIKETITRNVVWMLDHRGAGMAELSYLEPSPVSEYRLKKTFEASKTSYRLLMFQNLFRRTAVGNPRKPLVQLRDEAFERHGAPPLGAAKGLADSIKRIHQVENFPDFLTAMGLERPSAAWFTDFLRQCVEDSHKKGYSRMPLRQSDALALRRMKEPDLEVAPGVTVTAYLPDLHRLSFFPGKNGGNGGRKGGKDWRR
jgi:ubiquitin-protein ligase